MWNTNGPFFHKDVDSTFFIVWRPLRPVSKRCKKEDIELTRPSKRSELILPCVWISGSITCREIYDSQMLIIPVSLSAQITLQIHFCVLETALNEILLCWSKVAVLSEPKEYIYRVLKRRTDLKINFSWIQVEFFWTCLHLKSASLKFPLVW